MKQTRYLEQGFGEDWARGTHGLHRCFSGFYSFGFVVAQDWSLSNPKGPST